MSFANAVVVVLGVVLLGLGAAVAGMTLALSKGDDYPGRIP